MWRVDLNATAAIGRVAALGVALAGVLAAARAPAARLETAASASVVRSSSPISVVGAPPATTASMADRNVFRPAGSIVERRFDPELAIGASSAHHRETRDDPLPRLQLKGLVHGARPMAILEGVPGRTGASLLEEGTETAGLTLLRVLDAGVRVRWSDTTWILPLHDGGES